MPPKLILMCITALVAMTAMLLLAFSKRCERAQGGILGVYFLALVAAICIFLSGCATTPDPDCYIEKQTPQYVQYMCDGRRHLQWIS